MGREEAAKADRAVLRKAVVDEAIARLGEFESQLDQHKTVTNQQGRAMEALANCLTALLQDQARMTARLEALERSLWRRVQRVWRRLSHSTSPPKVVITTIPDEGLPPAPLHVHSYAKDGPFFYRCTLPDCGHRATLGEITRDAAYLRSLAPPADGSTRSNGNGRHETSGDD